MSKLVEHYDAAYQNRNFFGDREWLYEPYINALISKAGIKKASSVLDVGCGQGFFSYLLKKNGMILYATDISKVGIRMAKKEYGVHGIHLFVSDLREPPFLEKFDCIFIRGCSLHNNPNFAHDHEITETLLRSLKKGGTLLFAYCTDLSKSSSSGWINHCIEDAQKHFQRIKDIEFEVYFVNKLDLILLRKYAFNSLVTKTNILLVKKLRMRKSGELIVICKKV